MPKTILYLDQNYLSWLAKAAFVDTWADPNKPRYQRLLQVIRAQTAANKLVCPKSFFHIEESSASQSLSEVYWRLIDDLSHDISLRAYPEVHTAQVFLAARDFVGERQQVESWRIAYESNPDVPVKTGLRIMAHSGVFEAPDMVAAQRAQGDSAHKMYLGYRKQRATAGLRFVEEYEVQVDREVAEYRQMVRGAIPQATMPEGLRFLEEMGMLEVLETGRLLAEILRRSARPVDFWAAPQLRTSLFISIRAGLTAADIVFRERDKRNRGIFNDFNAVAAYLPYVTIMTVDKNTKEIIKQAGLLQRFPTTVLSSSQEDVQGLIASLEML